MTVSISRAGQSAAAQQDELALAIERTASARAIAGNTLQHHPDSPAAIEAMIALVASAQAWIHFENYIIRDDATGRRVAEALAERARAGVHVRILYDALGSFGTGFRFWRGLRHAGAEELGVPLDDHIAACIAALRPVEQTLGLGTSTAPSG